MNTPVKKIKTLVRIRDESKLTRYHPDSHINGPSAAEILDKEARKFMKPGKYS
jgi:hypothetical protein